MRLAIQNWIVDKGDDFKAVDMLSTAGFEYVDWDLRRYYPGKEYALESESECREYNTRLREHLDKRHLSVCQTHSLFPTYVDEKNELKVLTSMENCFLATSILGARYTVVHPMMPFKWEGEKNRELRIAKNVQFFNNISPLAEKYNLVICIENMFGFPIGIGKFNETACSRVEEIEEILSRLDRRELFGVCLDSGHANLLYGDSMTDVINVLGQDIKIVHLHDNNSYVDSHSLPGKGNVDWDTIINALKNVGYDGVYSFEIAPGCLGTFGRQKKLNTVHDILSNLLAKYE